MALDEYRLLGRSGLRVSPLCLGTMTFGEAWGFGEGTEESRKVFDTYLQAGGNFFDTANVYQNGQSEKMLGEYISSVRSQVVTATKFTLNPGPLMDANTLSMHGTGKMQNYVNLGGNSRKSLVENVDASLKRMGTGYTDVLYVHFWEYRTPIEEMMRALDDVVRAGKAMYVAISDAPAWVVSRANTMAELRGWTRFIGLQTRYNLLDRSFELDLGPMCSALDIGAVPWGAIAEGFLTGKYQKGQEISGGRSDSVKKHTSKEKNWKILETVQAIATSIDRSPVQVALNWLIHRPSVTSALIGARTMKQLTENIKSLEFQLSPDQMDQLDQVSAMPVEDLTFPYKFMAMGMSMISGEKKVEVPGRYRQLFKAAGSERFLTNMGNW